MEKYHINIFYSNDDKCFVADVPDLQHCSACGQNPEAALREVKRAMKAWLAAARAVHKRIPVPKYRPALYAAGRG